MRGRSQSAHDPASTRAFLRLHSLLLDYVDEPDKFQKTTTYPLDRLVKLVIQDGLSIADKRRRKGRALRLKYESIQLLASGFHESGTSALPASYGRPSV